MRASPGGGTPGCLGNPRSQVLRSARRGGAGGDGAAIATAGRVQPGPKCRDQPGASPRTAARLPRRLAFGRLSCGGGPEPQRLCGLSCIAAGFQIRRWKALSRI